MTLQDLGYNTKLKEYREQQNLGHFDMARVISEHRERYIVKTVKDEFEAEVVGNLRFTAQSRVDFPAVGDWVAISPYDDNKVLIHAIYPRTTVIERQAVGKHGEKQIIAANIDYGFIVQAVDRDFNINRIERYLTICNASKIKAIIILTKIDLTNDEALDDIIKKIQSRIKQVPIVAISNQTLTGYEELKSMITKGNTYCLLGSSGVGKSTLINNMSGQAMMKTDVISTSTKKGRHVTSHRELFVLKNGGILIDNPGMREVGIADTTNGVESTFDAILTLARKCRYKDCQHVSETGCAVLKAVEDGEIDKLLYENYLKIVKERRYFESTVAEKRKKDKDFGKFLKNYKKDRARNDKQ